jgi:hypothetical protein
LKASLTVKSQSKTKNPISQKRSLSLSPLLKKKRGGSGRGGERQPWSNFSQQSLYPVRRKRRRKRSRRREGTKGRQSTHHTSKPWEKTSGVMMPVCSPF